MRLQCRGLDAGAGLVGARQQAGAVGHHDLGAAGEGALDAPVLVAEDVDLAFQRVAPVLEGEVLGELDGELRFVMLALQTPEQDRRQARLAGAGTAEQVDDELLVTDERGGGY